MTESAFIFGNGFDPEKTKELIVKTLLHWELTYNDFSGEKFLEERIKVASQINSFGVIKDFYLDVLEKFKQAKK